MSNQWGFFEIAGAEAFVKLAEYQWQQFGTRIDEPVVLFREGVKSPVHYPDEEEAGRDMRKVVGEISPNKTRGIQ